MECTIIQFTEEPMTCFKETESVWMIKRDRANSKAKEDSVIQLCIGRNRMRNLLSHFL